MPILDLQRRMHQIGRIRLGQQVTTQAGKSRPAKLSTFRFTSQDDGALRAVASLFGGEPRRWEGAPTGEQWEIISEANTIPVVVPPAATAFSQWWELWSGGGCTRRCDGVTEMLSDSPCLCAQEDERSCTPHSRLNVILRDIPGIGVWRLDTSGYYAATELAGTVDVIMSAATRGQLLPAVLRLEQRQVKRAGEAVRKFAVPVLDIGVTPAALGLVVGSSAPAPALAPVDNNWQPIAEPAALPSGEIGAAIRNTADQPAAKQRRNSPPPLPPTGLNPRGARTDDTPTVDKPSTVQTAKAMVMFSELGMGGDEHRTERLEATSAYVGRTVTSWNELTRAEASTVIDKLQQLAADQPAPDPEPPTLGEAS